VVQVDEANHNIGDQLSVFVGQKSKVLWFQCTKNGDETVPFRGWHVIEWLFAELKVAAGWVFLPTDYAA